MKFDIFFFDKAENALIEACMYYRIVLKMAL